MAKYVVRPYKHARSQRITIPVSILRGREWQDTHLYLIKDCGEDFITIQPLYPERKELGDNEKKPRKL